MDLLIENEEIEPEETLRETFNKYLHPDAIDKDSQEVYDLIGSGDVADLFQFSTAIGYDSITKVKPSNLVEAASVNSLMRLQSASGEQPIDTFVRYKNDISLWYEEMQEHGLNEQEVSVMEEYLKILNGVADTQEVVMSMSMDERIAGFSVPEANKLRKVIASANSNAVEEIKSEFISSGLKHGNRQEFLDYVWDVQIARQLSYSFSILHTISYTISALQEVNLNLKHSPLYWETACLIVNSGGVETDSETTSNTGNVNYGKVAEALGNIVAKNVEVLPPNINNSGYTFLPDIENNAILYGMKGIVGVGEQIIDTIMHNRPYSSFQDFLTRLFDTKLVQNQHMLQLIKSGCFDLFGDRKEIMKEYLQYANKPRKNLTLASLNTVIELGVIPEEYSLLVRFFRYRQYIFSKSIGKSSERKTKNRLFVLDDISTEFLHEHFSDKCIVDFDEEYGLPIVAEWLFDREYDKKMTPLKEWLSKPETVDLVNSHEMSNKWIEVADGSLSKWEMSSLGYYYHEHELSHVNTEKYGIVDYNELSEDPVSVKEFQYAGQTRHEYEIHRIVGAVLDKDSKRHTVTILTPTGVVTVKMYRGNYSFYDKQISEVDSNGKKTVLEGSWFRRGNLIMFTGFRRGNQFVPRTYRNSVYQHSVALIHDIDEEGNLSLQTERV